jgi:hypothetical protein
MISDFSQKYQVVMPDEFIESIAHLTGQIALAAFAFNEPFWIFAIAPKAQNPFISANRHHRLNCDVHQNSPHI